MSRKTNLYYKASSLFLIVFSCIIMYSLPSMAAPPQVGLGQLAVPTWDRTYHGAAFDSFSAITATADGGMIATGPTYSGSAG